MAHYEDSVPDFIDPLLRRQHERGQHERNQQVPTSSPRSPIRRAAEPQPAPSLRRLRTPSRPSGRPLRVIGAGGMGSLLAVTGYVTAVAGHTDADQQPGAVSEPAAAVEAPVVAEVALDAPIVIVESTVAAAPVATTTIPACNIRYTVRSGDSWYRIASLARVAVDDLYAANNASAESSLFPDQSVCLPAGTAAITVPPTTAAPTTTSAPPAATTTLAPQPAVPAKQPQSSSQSS